MFIQLHLFHRYLFGLYSEIPTLMVTKLQKLVFKYKKKEHPFDDPHTA